MYCYDRYTKKANRHIIREIHNKFPNFFFQVYISTSDVQMHANYHRKDSAILQEGFQRFRATESCSAPHCVFAGQRTTHFHCRRPGCTYTFKNKADMGKLHSQFTTQRFFTSGSSGLISNIILSSTIISCVGLFYWIYVYKNRKIIVNHYM